MSVRRGWVKGDQSQAKEGVLKWSVRGGGSKWPYSWADGVVKKKLDLVSGPQVLPQKYIYQNFFIKNCFLAPK